MESRARARRRQDDGSRRLPGAPVRPLEARSASAGPAELVAAWVHERQQGGLRYAADGAGAATPLLALQRLVGNAAIADVLTSDHAGDAPPQSATPVQRLVLDRPETHPVLRFGSTDPEVAGLQERLNEEGVADPPLDVDANFGRLTRAAVREFQARHGLAVDGVVGIRTWGVLDELGRRGIAGPTSTALDDVASVDETAHNDVEAILHPGTTPGDAGPTMTGTGAGGAYETEVIAALNTLAAEVIARPVATPAVNMDHANRVGDQAQEEVEAFFGGLIALSSRAPSGAWHPGSTRMGLADATTRSSDDQDILGWTNYFMDNGSYPPAQIAAAHHYNGTRSSPDKHEHDRVRDLWLSSGGRAKVDKMVRAWPAEASTGTVFLQLRDPAYQTRVGMWDLFGTLVHEFLHLVTHPNYMAVADAEGGGAGDILAEGMDEHFKNEVWNAVRPRIASDIGFRTLVEGPFAAPVVNTADYDAGSEIDHAILDHHYDSLAQADAIANRVGEQNAQAAFFMGHAEALGIGRGSASENSLRGLAGWTPSGGGSPDEYVVGPDGETVARIRERTGSTHIEDAAGMVWVDASHVFAAGERLRIPGLRWHTAIAQDTRAQIANQHGISQDDLERANGLAHAPGATPVPAGRVLMIPVGP